MTSLALIIAESDPIQKELMISFMASKAQLIWVEIKNYLRELKENREDAEIALARRNNNSDKLLTSEEATELLKKKYGL